MSDKKAELFKIAYIYSIRNKINNKIYIGLTKRTDANRRKLEHYDALNKKKHNNNHLQYSWNKYGEDNFEFKIIEKLTDISRDELSNRESFWISQYSSNDSKYGYNKTSGGEIGFVYSKDIIEKMSNAQKGKTLSKETREKISKANIGKVGYWRNKKLSKSTKLKMSISRKGKKNGPLSNEHKKKISEANKGQIPWIKGKKHSEQSKLKMSNSLKGRKTGPLSDEHKKKLSEVKKGKETWIKGKKLDFNQKLNSTLAKLILSEEEIVNIYLRVHRGETIKNLASEYKIDKQIISRIKRKVGVYEYVIDKNLGDDKNERF